MSNFNHFKDSSPQSGDNPEPWLPKDAETWRVRGFNVSDWRDGEYGDCPEGNSEPARESERVSGFGQIFDSKEHKIRFTVLKGIAERLEDRLEGAALPPAWENSFTCVIHHSLQVLQEIKDDLELALDKFYGAEVAAAFRKQSDDITVLRELRMDFPTAHEVPLLRLVMRLGRIHDDGVELLSRQIP